MGFGGLGYFTRPAPPSGAPVLLYNAAGRPIQVAGGQVLPRGGRPGPVVLYGPSNQPIRVAGGQVVPEVPPSGPVLLYDPAGRPQLVLSGEVTAPAGAATTLTGQSRLVTPAGEPIGGGPRGPAPILVDPYGRPLPLTQPTGPVIVDLQAGTPTFLQGMVERIPGAQGVGLESAGWILGYQGIHPTNPDDLALALQIARQSPIWPSTPAWRTPLSAMPRLLPWEIDPASYLFPRAGAVRIFPEPFFPPIGGEVSPGVRRLIPLGISDVQGIQPTTHPWLHGVADQIYLRRPFGLAAADAATTQAMGQELNAMLRPGGFVEFRLRAQTELSVAVERQAGADQVAVIASQIRGARVVRVDRGAIQRFLRRGELPSDPLQREILLNAASDIRGLGEGAYARIIRIYKGQ
jgi:hypothetical protein